MSVDTSSFKWCGVGSVYGEFATYTTVPYAHSIPIAPGFEKYKTLADLDLDTLENAIHSPTNCEFCVDQGEIFYCDSQDCVRWGLEEKTGFVYFINPRDKSMKKTYAAMSLPEFLSRLQWECNVFKVKMDEMLSKHKQRSQLPKKSSVKK